jgi:hypothetical protein
MALCIGTAYYRSLVENSFNLESFYKVKITFPFRFEINHNELTFFFSDPETRERTLIYFICRYDQYSSPFITLCHVTWPQEDWQEQQDISWFTDQVSQWT